MTGILLGPRYAGTDSGAVAMVADSVFGRSRAYWQIRPDGFTWTFNGALHRSQAWINPQVGMANFEVKVEPAGMSDAFNDGSSSPLYTWIPISSGPRWGFDGVFAKDAILLVSIRRISDGALLVDGVAITIELGGSGTL